MPNITIDGKDYDTDSLSEESKGHLSSLRVVDGEIQRIKVQLAIAQTARNSVAEDLRVSLTGTSAKKAK